MSSIISYMNLESNENDDEIFMTDEQNNQYKYYKKAVKYIANMKIYKILML